MTPHRHATPTEADRCGDCVSERLRIENARAAPPDRRALRRLAEAAQELPDVRVLSERVTALEDRVEELSLRLVDVTSAVMELRRNR